MSEKKVLDKYAVFGHPIEHSKSPYIHTLFAQQTGQALTYSKQLVDKGQFAQAADAFFRSGGKGINITVPFKLDAYSYAARLTSRARTAGAVNTLAVQEDGTILGDNTDGIGLVNDIVRNQGWEIKNKHILILGAGGAARGVLQPVLEQAPMQVVIANRTPAKALQLARGFRKLGNIQSCGFEDLGTQQFDMVINATAASLTEDLPPLPDDILAGGASCYDLMYAAEPTAFMRWAEGVGCAKVVNGLGMLVEQAAESFFLWRGVRPPVDGVIRLLMN